MKEKLNSFYGQNWSILMKFSGFECRSRKSRSQIKSVLQPILGVVNWGQNSIVNILNKKCINIMRKVYQPFLWIITQMVTCRLKRPCFRLHICILWIIGLRPLVHLCTKMCMTKVFFWGHTVQNNFLLLCSE